jgi:hypothetical protein
MDHGDFASVSWQNSPRNSTSRRNTGSSTDGGEHASGSSHNGMRKATGSSSRPSHGGDPLDLAGLGGGTLECTVNSPIKENDGTKDVFVSYLVTTHVRIYSPSHFYNQAEKKQDYIPLFREANNCCSETVHGLHLSLQYTLLRVSSMCHTTYTRQT